MEKMVPGLFPIEYCSPDQFLRGNLVRANNIPWENGLRTKVRWNIGSTGGSKDFRLGPVFPWIIDPRTNFHRKNWPGDQYSMEKKVLGPFFRENWSPRPIF